MPRSPTSSSSSSSLSIHPNRPPWNPSPLIDSRGTLSCTFPALPGLFEEQTVVADHVVLIASPPEHEPPTLKRLRYRSLSSKPVPKLVGGRHDSANMCWRRSPTDCDSLYADPSYDPKAAKVLEEHAAWSVLPDDNNDGPPTLDAGTLVNAPPPPASPR
ncbi:hypothetical protein TeGR_g6929, partial [Tetraparma gracilis]